MDPSMQPQYFYNGGGYAVYPQQPPTMVDPNSHPTYLVPQAPQMVYYAPAPAYYSPHPTQYQAQPMPYQPQPQPQHCQQPLRASTTIMQYVPEVNDHHRMMSSDPDVVECIDDISQISLLSSPDSFHDEQHVRHPSATTPHRRISMPAHKGSLPSLVPTNYKTRMCTQWIANRHCTMRGACKFAHGAEELRCPDRLFRTINNSKYKTKMCKNFEPGASGICAYAERCEYIHPTDREYLFYKDRIEAAQHTRDALSHGETGTLRRQSIGGSLYNLNSVHKENDEGRMLRSRLSRVPSTSHLKTPRPANKFSRRSSLSHFNQWRSTEQLSE